MRGSYIAVGILALLAALTLVGQYPQHVRLGIVQDWTTTHVLFPNSNDPAVMARIRQDPRYVYGWYRRHPEAGGRDIILEPVYPALAVIGIGASRWARRLQAARRFPPNSCSM